MKSFVAVLGREIAERKLLFVGVAVGSLFPIVAPWLPGLSGQRPAELRGGMALGLALITSTLLALVLGTTVIGRDLSERRIGFYFARPIPGWAIWAGKMLSAALLSWGAGALILLVALLAGAKIDPTGYWGPAGIPGAGGGGSAPALFLFAGLGILVLLAVSHAVGIMVRSRSPWLALDLLVLALVVTTVWSSSRLLQREGAFLALTGGGLGFAALSVVSLLLAGLVQVVRGRTDLRRGHRLLSLILWTLVGVATLGHAAFAQWTLRVTPADLESVHGVLPAPAGNWIALTGYARNRGGYSPTFLLDGASGRFLKLQGSGHPFWNPPVFSQDGSLALWFELVSGDSYQLQTVDLRHPEPVLRRLGLYSLGDFRVVLSPDGRRVAVLKSGRLTVDDLETGRMLASVPLEGRAHLLFLEAGRVRIIRPSIEDEPGMPELWRLTTLDLDVAGNRLVPVSRIELPETKSYAMVSPDGRRAILRQPDAPAPLIADLETGRTVPAPGRRTSLQFLEDGRMFRLRWEGNRVVLSLVAPDGAERLHAPLPGTRIRIGSNVAPDLLAVATAKEGSSKEIKPWTSWILDLRTGRLRKIGSRMIPAIEEAGTGTPAARLFLRDPGGLALLDPETGQLRSILPGRPVEAGLWLARSRWTRSEPL